MQLMHTPTLSHHCGVHAADKSAPLGPPPFQIVLIFLALPYLRRAAGWLRAHATEYNDRP